MIEYPPGQRKWLFKLHEGKGPGGRNLCRWCGQEVATKRRQTWCSQKCVDEYNAIATPERQRQFIYDRDKGICQICGVEPTHTEWKIKAYLRSRPPERIRWSDISTREIKEVENPDWAKQFKAWFNEGEALKGQYKLKFAALSWRDNVSFWQIDHIVPLVEGGTSDPSNLRLLCTSCHKSETALLRKRLAEQRKQQKGE